MAIMDPIPARALAVRLIPNVSAGLAEALHLRPDQLTLHLCIHQGQDLGSQESRVGGI